MSLPPGHLIHWPQPPGQPDSALTLAAAAPDPVLPPPDASLIFTRPLLFSIFAQNHIQPSLFSKDNEGGLCLLNTCWIPVAVLLHFAETQMIGYLFVHSAFYKHGTWQVKEIFRRANI